ncbi:MAG: RDD family protein, partial [Candidatus Eremiobacteraeota bacterium]|nr:RDD family protein [Candidatus Eremiobacteraeota bacterium]
MERSVTVRTPEAIAFYYELAGLGSRFLALCVDTVIQVAVLVALLTVGIASTRGVTAIASSLHIGQKMLGSSVAAAIILTIFLLFYGYFIAFEMLWSGQTPGKRLLGIRVVRDGGYPVELGGSIIRNLIRVLEFGF